MLFEGVKHEFSMFIKHIESKNPDKDFLSQDVLCLRFCDSGSLRPI